MRFAVCVVFGVFGVGGIWGGCKDASPSARSSSAAVGGGSGAAVPAGSAAVAPALPIELPPFELAAPADKITAISGDAEAVCALRASGHVDCWGAWSDDPQGRVKRVADVDDAIGIQVTKSRRCIVRRRGLWCASDGGDGDAQIALPPGVEIDEISHNSPCARTTGGRIACWNPSEPARPAVLVPRLKDIAHVGGVCAVTVKRRVQCDLSGRWERVPELGHVRTFAAGWQAGEEEQFQSACAILDDDSVRCFMITQVAGRRGLRLVPGDDKPETARALRGATALAFDDHGLIALVGGKVLTVSDEDGVRAIPRLTDAVAITPRCALRAQGSVVCWGDHDGTLGQPRRAGARSAAPVPVVGIADVVSVARTVNSGWAVTREGKLFHWGAQRTGWPIQVPFDGEAAQVVADPRGYGDEACVVRRDHRVSCRVGQGGFEDIGLADVAALRSDGILEIARLANGTGVTWYGIKPAEREVMHNVEGAVEIASVSSPRCYRTATAVKCTPYECVPDRRGVCSYEDHPYVEIPVADVVELAHGRGSLCARTRQRTVVCWSDAAFAPGPAGSGSGAPVRPEPIAGITDAVGLTSDGETVCAVRADGRLTCWGGDKPTPPHDVLPAGSVAPPVIGAADGCTIRPDGRPACWGNDDGGQLGAGAIIHLDSPAAVPGL